MWVLTIIEGDNTQRVECEHKRILRRVAGEWFLKLAGEGLCLMPTQDLPDYHTRTTWVSRTRKVVMEWWQE